MVLLAAHTTLVRRMCIASYPVSDDAQVAISAKDDPASSYSPFKLIHVSGYEHGAAGSIYLATVKANPIDARHTLLGLFAVNLGRRAIRMRISTTLILESIAA